VSVNRATITSCQFQSTEQPQQGNTFNLMRHHYKYRL